MEPQAVFQLTESFFSFQKEGSSKSAAWKPSPSMLEW
jgi:hypothetical protein